MATNCAFCGAHLRATAKICVKCGELVTDTPPSGAVSHSTAADAPERASVPQTTTEAPVFEHAPTDVTPNVTSSPAPANHAGPVKSPSSSLPTSLSGEKLAIAVFVVVFVVVVFIALFRIFGSKTGGDHAGKSLSVDGTSNEQVLGGNPADPAQLCRDINDCLTTVLRSAADEDVDTVRQVALRIDSFEKPAPGNKTLARKLNAQALQAFNQGDFQTAAEVFQTAYHENPKDVEIAGNLGLSLVRSGQFNEALKVLKQALILDPRRTSTWTPIAEAYALMGKPVAALSAMWIGYQWSNDRQKSINFYMDKADSMHGQNQELYELYANMLEWAQGTKPVIFHNKSLTN